MTESTLYKFFDSNCPFNPTFEAKYTLDDLEFFNVYQGISYDTAMYLNEHNIANAILKVHNSLDIKNLIKLMTKQDITKTNGYYKKLVVKHNYAKFNQNKLLFKKLIATGNKRLVFTSPFDKLLGIGIVSSNPKSDNSTQWQGKNLLGDVLTKVKYDLLKQHIQRKSASNMLNENANKEISIKVVNDSSSSESDDLNSVNTELESDNNDEITQAVINNKLDDKISNDNILSSICSSESDTNIDKIINKEELDTMIKPKVEDSSDSESESSDDTIDPTDTQDAILLDQTISVKAQKTHDSVTAKVNPKDRLTINTRLKTTDTRKELVRTYKDIAKVNQIQATNRYAPYFDSSKKQNSKK